MKNQVIQTLIPGDDSWVEDKILEAKKVLDGELPMSATNCNYCLYVNNTK